MGAGGEGVAPEYIEKRKGRQSRKVELRTTATMGKAKIVARCHWASNDLSILYVDEEWGEALHDDRRLLEFLILEGAQAGLIWDTILRKRASYHAAFDGFDPHLMVGYRDRKIRQLLRNPGIVRNRLKIHSAIQNSQAFLKVQEEFGSFDAYIWQFVGGQPKQNAWRTSQQA